MYMCVLCLSIFLMSAVHLQFYNEHEHMIFNSCIISLHRDVSPIMKPYSVVTCVGFFPLFFHAAVGVLIQIISLGRKLGQRFELRLKAWIVVGWNVSQNSLGCKGTDQFQLA